MQQKERELESLLFNHSGLRLETFKFAIHYRFPLWIMSGDLSKRTRQ